MLTQQRKRRKYRIRAKVFGTAKRPRLAVFRSSSHISAQLVDDESGETLLAFGDVKLGKIGKMSKVEIAGKVGEGLAEMATKKKIKQVVFDRAGYKYHGRVKALAEGARKGGLQIGK